MAARAASTQEALRRRNLSALLTQVHLGGPTSRAALTAGLGLNRSTIGALTGDLVAAGLVREAPGGSRRAAGRPSHLVLPEADRVFVVALHLGVDHMAAASVGLGGQVLARRERPHARGERSLPSVVRAAAAMTRSLLAAAPPGSTCVGVGAGVAGVIRVQDGLVRFGPNLGWVDAPLGAALSTALRLPVRVANDADLGALAEHIRGAAAGVDDLVYLAGEVGLGGGVIVGGHPLVGRGGYAGELGHLVVNPSGRRCRCGSRGCWETEVGEDALLVPAGRAPGGGLAAVREVVTAAAAGEDAAATALARVARWLGVGLGAVVNLLNPAMVIFGGVLSEVYAAAAPAVEQAMAHSALAAPREQVRLALPGLGPDSTLLGAAELAFAPLLDDPLAVAPGRGQMAAAPA